MSLFVAGVIEGILVAVIVIVFLLRTSRRKE